MWRKLFGLGATRLLDGAQGDHVLATAPAHLILSTGSSEETHAGGGVVLTDRELVFDGNVLQCCLGELAELEAPFRLRILSPIEALSIIADQPGQTPVDGAPLKVISPETRVEVAPADTSTFQTLAPRFAELSLSRNWAVRTDESQALDPGAQFRHFTRIARERIQ